MIKIYEKESGVFLDEIDEEDLRILMNTLEEESSRDRDYFINRDTIDLLTEAGASEHLLRILREATMEAGETEIRWSQE